MDENLKNSKISTISLPNIIQLFCSTIGLIFYLTSAILFKFYYNSPVLITREIFSFILLYSLKPVIGLILSSSITSELILYCIRNISFYFIIEYINRCLTSKKLSDSTINYELGHKNFIYLLFLIISFPLIKIFNLSEIYNYAENLINIILVIFLYRYINTRFLFLLDYLREKKATNSTIPDIYLPYMKAYYYYTTFNSIHMIFFDSLILIICCFSFNILYILLKKNFLCYFSVISEKIAVFCLIYGCLMFFYSFNKRIFGIGKNELNDEEVNIAKFTVVDVDIQQDDKEESSTRIKKNKKIEDKVSKDDESYVKIDAEETKETDKEKENNIKISEEAESLNK